MLKAAAACARARGLTLSLCLASAVTLAATGPGCSTTDPTPTDDAGLDSGAADAHSETADGADAADPCAADNGDGAPLLLECTGLYRSPSDRTLSDGVRAYTPGVVFWSDGAEKHRWVSLPPGTTIDTTLADEWQFPQGTKFWKEFRVAGRTAETRFMWKNDPKRWTFAVYRWNDAGTSATSIPYGERDVYGTTYEIAATSQCEDCHAGRRDRVLGFEEFALGLETANGVTLDMLATEGALSVRPPVTKFALPNDGSGKAAPALAFMHMNCGTSCHNANSRANANFTGLFMRLHAADVRSGDGGSLSVESTDTWKTAVGAAIKMKGYETSDWKRVSPSEPEKSLIVYLAEHRGENGAVDQMPPVGTHTPDVEGVAALKAWVSSLPK